MSRRAEKAKFRDSVDRLLTDFHAADHATTFLGADPGPPLEHVTRRHFIDHFLDALGWDLTRLNDEMIEEARTRGETTRRIDYLGVNQASRVPLLVVEAKAWTVPFVAPSAKQESLRTNEPSSPMSLICAAVEHAKKESSLDEAPVTKLWAEYIDAVTSYVKTVFKESGHAVPRVAMLSGQWLIVFNDPKATFLDAGTVNPTLIRIYRGDDLVRRAEEIFDQLARNSLNSECPPLLRPSLAYAYIGPQSIRHVFRALWISRHTIGPSWKPKPNIELQAAIVLQRKDGLLLTVIDQSAPDISLPHDYDKLPSHIGEVTLQADKLLATLNGELKTSLNVDAVELFPGFSSTNTGRLGSLGHSGQLGHIDLIKMQGRSEFLLVTGTHTHFVRASPAVDPCPSHDWAYCLGKGQETSAAVYAPSVEPKTFFVSSCNHHCANQIVHDRRRERCQIDAFEEFICCRACVFEPFCWAEEELLALPCGVTAI